MRETAYPPRKTGPGSAPMSDCTVRLALAVMIVVAVVLRFWRISAQSIWLDEAASWVLSITPVGDLLLRNMDRGNPPLYYLALAGWLRLFGDSETALRSLTAVLGALTVPVLYLFGKELFDRRVGLIAALLLALSPIHIYYSQEARQYVPVLLLGLLSAWLLVRALRTNRWGQWFGAAFFAALAFYTHYSGLLVPVFEGVYLLLAHRQRTRALAAAAFLAILCLPGIVLYLGPSFLSAGGYVYWQDRATPMALVKMLNTIFGKPVTPDSPLLLKGVGAALILFAIGYPLWFGVRAAREEHTAALQPEPPRHLAIRRLPVQYAAVRPLLFVLCYLIAPVALFVAVAWFKPIWQDRYVFLALPAFFLLLAWVLVETGKRQRALLLASVTALSAAGMLSTYTRTKGDWRDVAKAIRGAMATAKSRDGEIILTPPFMRIPFDYYYREGMPRTGFPHTDSPQGAIAVTRQDNATLDALAERAARASSQFIIYAGKDADPDLRVARRLAELKGPGRYIRYSGVLLFAFGEAAPGLRGTRVTADSLGATADVLFE